jgi:hypothetical protein
MDFVRRSLVKPEKAQDEENDDHQADEIDDAVHGDHLASDIPASDCANPE